jgi:hypothetical protein
MSRPLALSPLPIPLAAAAVLAAAFLLPPLLRSVPGILPAHAAGDEGEEYAAAARPQAFQAIGVAKKHKTSGYYTFAYLDGKAKLSAFLKIPEDAQYLMDTRIRLEELAEGESVWVFGRLVEHETADGTGRRGTDRQLQNVSAIVGGKELKVDESFKDASVPDSKWHRVTVSRPGAAIWVKAEGDEFKVVLRKNTPIVRRVDSPKGPLKSGAWIEVAAKEHDGRPETKSSADAKKASYIAQKVVLLDPGLVQTVYPMLAR